jgi:glycosyltransferase involved in cell wall biosynthesis
MLLFGRSRKLTVGIKGREIQINWLRQLKGKPDVSVVVVVYNMGREAPRTLHSLSAGYQRHIDSDEYEVIVVDNGSSPPLDPQMVTALDGNFRLIRIDHALPSPAQAINKGIAVARGAVVGVMIDGARIVTPGLLHFARHGARLYDRAVVATLGWYLGHDLQCQAISAGYNQAAEDALLNSIDWPSDGYRLFEIGTLDESSIDGWLKPISESNALFLRRESWELLGGLDERFDAPGGGLVNLDTFGRALELADAELVILLSEGTFHQMHGGVSTNAPPENQQDNWTRWSSQYERIRGRPYEQSRPKHAPSYLGTLAPAALARIVQAAIDQRALPK